MAQRSCSDRFIQRQRGCRDESIRINGHASGTGKCPLCNEALTTAKWTVDKHIGLHIRQGDIAVIEANGLRQAIYSRH